MMIDQVHMMIDQVHMMIAIPPKYAVSQGYSLGASTVGRDEAVIGDYILRQ